MLNSSRTSSKEKDMSHRIDEFNELPDVAKNMLLGFADARQEQIAENNKILSAFHDEGRGLFVIAKFGDYAVLEAFGRHVSVDKGGLKYPYTSAYFKDEKWHPTHHFFDKIEGALLCALGFKEEGHNSKYHHYAYNMLFSKQS